MNTPGFIPAYEHGFGIKKTHQTVLGNDRVSWREYLLPQTLSNKQHVLNSFSTNSKNIIILNHPGMRNGYDYSDFQYLTNYHCMEVLNPSVISLAQWDSALSFGKPVFIVGNDDSHNVFTEDRLGSMCTWVNVSSVNKENVLDALRKGKNYGMIVGKSKESLPFLKQFVVANDSILIEMSKAAKQITFSGKNGQVLGSFNNTSSAQYIFKSADNYVRAHIAYENGTAIFLNPVFRYNKTNISQVPVFINFKKTFIFRLMGAIILAIWIWMIFLFLFSKQTRKKLGKPFNIFSRNIFTTG